MSHMKHPSVRRRRNIPRRGFRSLPAAARSGTAPQWPLGRDVGLQAALEVAQDQVAKTQLEFEEESDGRKRGRLRRTLDKLEMQVARLDLTVQMARDAELELWAYLWTMPQSVLWEEAFAHREVASYVRWQIRAEQGHLNAAAEARQRGDRLGMTPLALARLQSEVESASEAGEKGQQRRASKAPPKKSTAKTDPREALRGLVEQDRPSHPTTHPRKDTRT